MKKLFRMVHTQFNVQVKCAISDNIGELCEGDMKLWYAQLGISV